MAAEVENETNMGEPEQELQSGSSSAAEDDDDEREARKKKKESVKLWQATLSGLGGSENSAQRMRRSCSSLDQVESHNFRMSVKLYILSWKFDLIMCCVIMFNAIVIGVEQQWSVDHEDRQTPLGLHIVEHFLLVVFVLELIVRLMAQGLHVAARNGWWLFDAMLVFLGISFSWLGPMLRGGEVQGTAVVMMLRMARMVRLARVFQVIVRFKTMAMLAKGLQNCITTVLCTLTLLMLILYVASTISMEIITQHRLARGPEADIEFQEHVEHYFASLPVTMLTLMQFVTLDNMNLIYWPLITKDWRLSWFFVSLVMVISVILMNIITGVVVNSAMEASLEDREKVRKAQEIHRKRTLMKELKRLFKSLDTDGNGMLTRGEVEEVFNTGESDMAVLQQFGLDPVEVFDMMVPDGDDTAEISITEFCDTLSEVMESGLEMKRLEKNMKEVKGLLAEAGPIRTERLKLLTGLGVRKLPSTPAARSLAARQFMSEGGRSRRRSAHSTQEGDETIGNESSFRPIYSSATSGAEMPDWAKEMMQELREIRCTLLPIALQHGADVALRSQDFPDVGRLSSKLSSPCNPAGGSLSKVGSDKSAVAGSSRALSIEVPDTDSRPSRGAYDEGFTSALKTRGAPWSPSQGQVLLEIPVPTRPQSVDTGDHSVPSAVATAKTPKADPSPLGQSPLAPIPENHSGRGACKAELGRLTPAGSLVSPLSNSLASAKRRREAL